MPIYDASVWVGSRMTPVKMPPPPSKGGKLKVTGSYRNPPAKHVIRMEKVTVTGRGPHPRCTVGFLVAENRKHENLGLYMHLDPTKIYHVPIRHPRTKRFTL